MKNIFKILFFALLLSLIWLMMSCGTRKVETIHKDSISINNSYSQGEKIVLGNTFTYTPIDALKPIKIDGKEYQNVIITNNKDRIVEKWKNRNITKTITVEKKKQSEKSDYSIMWIGIAFVIVAGIVAYFKIPSIRL